MKHSADHVWIQINGHDITPVDLLGFAHMEESTMVDTTGVGKGRTARKRTPADFVTGSLEQQDTYWDPDTVAFMTMLSEDPNVDGYVGQWGYDDQVIGAPAYGAGGVKIATVRAGIAVEDLQKAMVTYEISGPIDKTVILQPAEDKSATWDTEASSVDNGAATANGGAGLLTVEDFADMASLDVVIVHSADDVAYSTAVAFVSVTAENASERVEISGTVNQYLAVQGTVTTPGASPLARPTVAFARNP